MEAASYPLRIPKNILELAHFRTKEEHIDKSTALRQLLYIGAQDYVLDMYKKAEIQQQSLLHRWLFSVQF